jgi:1-deoxy-D-xylulose-5-phosphate reductoisomerase
MSLILPNVEAILAVDSQFGLAKDGNIPCALNAANEIAVQAFLDERIAFLDITRINEHVMNQVVHISKPSLDDYIATDLEARRMASLLVGK